VRLKIFALLTAFVVTFNLGLSNLKTHADQETMPSNELGKIMILEYHQIGYPESQWRRTPENFRKDLEMMYENDYYPIPLQDLVNGNIKAPAGKTPFVITFDDSSAGQFRYLKKEGRLEIDPKSGVGIMEQFKKEHPDFPLTATFYVLPGTGKNNRLFGQEEYIREKLNFLVQNGYEIGNHSYWHENLSKVDDLAVQKQLALAVKEIQSFVPGYQVKSFALPYGIHPNNRILARQGEYQGIKYNHNSVMLVGSGPVPSPYSTEFNPYKMERIQAGDTPWGPKSFVEKFRKNPSLRFISDGDPVKITIPKNLEGKLSLNLSRKFRLQMLDDSAPSLPTKKMQ
jgi:peptidoglycan/xylan/chitin deacetylase (PgdA/CDA1 family)